MQARRGPTKADGRLERVRSTHDNEGDIVKRYQVRIEYASIETVTYEVEAEGEPELTITLNDFLDRGEHVAMIERSRTIDVDEKSASITFVKEIEVDEPKPKERFLKLI